MNKIVRASDKMQILSKTQSFLLLYTLQKFSIILKSSYIYKKKNENHNQCQSTFTRPYIKCVYNIAYIPLLLLHKHPI